MVNKEEETRTMIGLLDSACSCWGFMSRDKSLLADERSAALKAHHQGRRLIMAWSQKRDALKTARAALSGIGATVAVNVDHEIKDEMEALWVAIDGVLRI